MMTAQSNRIAEGGQIDRSSPIQFSFNGKQYSGFKGDTLASALLANGVRVVSRSFKFHRPRGIFSAGYEEPNALLGVDVGNGTIPITRATLTPLVEGLKAETQNCFPSLGFDLGRILDYTRFLWPAGFYNKIFKWPNWHTYEWAVRKTAGLGVLPSGQDAARYRHVNAHCDVLVVGSGPAGIAAALEATCAGEDVLLVEQDFVAGGSLLFDNDEVDGVSASDFLARSLAELGDAPNVRVMLNSTVAGYYDHNVLSIHDQSASKNNDKPVETYWKVRARRVVLATGAIEQPLMFGNNDLPGVMQLGALLKYRNRFGVICGNRVVAAVNNDLAWRTACKLHDAGISIATIVDTREKIGGRILAAAAERSIETHVGTTLVRARGSNSVKSLRVLSADGGPLELECDVLAVGGGLSPTVHLYSQAGGKLKFDGRKQCFVPDSCAQSVDVVGAANGSFANADDYNISERSHGPKDTDSQWVDYLHDVTVSDIELAVRENFVSVEHLKRYTTTGMAVDQGKTSNLNALSLLGKLTYRSPGEVGTTTFRPQFMPVTLGAIGGNRRDAFYHPVRRLATHDWHEKRQAVFDDYGGWKRPAYYGEDREESIGQEVLNVRKSVSLLDGSALGKFEVKGPDAAEFLSRVYVNTVHTLKPGKVRYGLMLNENGVVIDDGIFVRLADDHFLVNSTSGGADRIGAWLEEWRQCEYPDLRVLITSVTTQWSVATVAGPHARDVLQKLSGMINMDTESFPHMSFDSGSFDDGTPFRIQRVSFSGEQSYELSVPSDRAVDVFDQIMFAGAEYDIGLLGVEALLVLRTEKGYIHVGVDTDAMTNPLDIGFGGIVANKKTDFIGARSLQRSNDQRSDRRQLVGFEVPSGIDVFAGAHFVTSDSEKRSEGFVTSACCSPTLDRVVGLGLLERGSERKGENVDIFYDGNIIQARIVDTCFYDPDGEKINA